MTKSESLHKFMSGFGLKAYPTNAVPIDAVRPYIRYTKGFSPDGYSSTIDIFYHTESELIPDKKAEEICNSLRNGGIQLKCDGGTLWLTLEDPEWYSGTDDNADATNKHRIINVLITDHTTFR